MQPIQLDENQEENLRDIRLLFEMLLSLKVPVQQKDVIFAKLVEKSEGVFLYAYFLIDHISEAAIILENRLPTVSCMKYLDNQEENGAIQARFYCSDTVACFDVTPGLDYMVYECRNGTIHLWSLETANLD